VDGRTVEAALRGSCHGVEVGESAIPGAEFDVPDFVNDPLDLRRVALVVIGALEKWEKVEGLEG
jgi:hypothetical protein